MANLPTAYIAWQGARVHLDGGVLLVDHPDHPTSTIPLGHVGGIVLLGAVDLTTAAMRSLADRGIACVLASRSARIHAVMAPWVASGHARRAAQHRVEAIRASGAAPGPHLLIARAIVDAKCAAILDILSQHQRTHADVDLSGPIASIRSLREHGTRAAAIDELRGYEGATAAAYFAAMPALCRGELTTAKRSRRPPRDPINAALSFGYSLIACEMTAALLARGLDPALGVLHPPEDGRPSLALDLIEPIRHTLVDRLVLRAVNRRELGASDFTTVAHAHAADPGPEPLGPTCRFSDSGRGKFLRLFQSAMARSDAEPAEPDGGCLAAGRGSLSVAIAAYESLLQA